MTIRRGFAFLLLLAMLAQVSSLGQGTFTQIRSRGATDKCINLVYLSEGYTAGQLTNFMKDATNLMNNLMTTPPWSGYSNCFNVFTIAVPSNESGSDHYTPAVTLADTYFNSTYDSYGIQRLLTIPPNDRDPNSSHGSGKVYALLQQYVPDYDIVGLIVNDTIYGGSGGSLLATSVNSSSREIFNHEIGHTFAHLGDEYTSAYPGFPNIEEPNTTTNTVRASIKWNAWIDPSTLVPTPDVTSNNAVVGLFLGAHYQTNGWYRPKHDCKMRTLGVAYCQVCAQELVLSYYKLIRPIQDFTPAQTNLTAANLDPAAFSVSLRGPSTNSLVVRWFTNGVVVAGVSSTNLNLPGNLLRTGTNQIQVVVNDATSYVRADSAGLLSQTNAWRLNVIAAPNISSPKYQRAANTFTVSTPTQPGCQYVLEFKNTLSNAVWTAVRTNNGTGGMITLTNTGAPGSNRFYRVRVQGY